jgi:arylsulfatase A-like enzyme
MSPEKDKPNIIVILADDLGYGDVGCYGGTGIPTPNIDRLAAEGLRFTDGYATAATCTPSRYSLLTGTYPWRNPRARILEGDAPAIISRDETTLPKLLKQAGYATGVVGKWHLGLGNGKINWNSELDLTPNDAGFDYSFIMAATNDRVPCVYLENRRVVGLDPSDPIETAYAAENPFPEQPSGKSHPELLRMRYSHGHDQTIVNGVSRIGFMKGGKSALWNDEDMADVFSGKATEFARQHRTAPFFLYYALHEPHVPRLPHSRFAGTTGLGPRGDAIAEMDWCVGRMMDTLEELGLSENTIVIFSSDNGPVLDDGYEDGAVELTGDHHPAGPLRGGKYSRYDGGTRVPFLLHWPQTVAPGVSSALVCHSDFCASFASLTGVTVPQEGCPDSENILEALLGKSRQGRHELVTEGLQGKTLLRRDNWAFLPAIPGSRYHANVGTELGNSHWDQLYDLGSDIGQDRNLAGERPEIVTLMRKRLQDIIKGAS